MYNGRVPGMADLVCFWFSKAQDAIASGSATRVGLVATNSIRGGDNRAVLDRVCAESRIIEAWSDEDWVLDGAAVNVSLISWGGVEARAQDWMDMKSTRYCQI
jgi:hypothetical protein